MAPKRQPNAKAPGKTTRGRKPQPFDYSTVKFHIEGEPTAREGLAKKRKRLEVTVDRLLSVKPTGFVIAFRGKKRHLRHPGNDSAEYWAVMALQHLYRAEAAQESGDIDGAMLHAAGFADAEAHRMNFELTGGDTKRLIDARMVSIKGGRTHLKWTDEVQRLAEQAFQELPASERVNEQRAAMRIRAFLEGHGHNISVNTIKRRFLNAGL